MSKKLGAYMVPLHLNSNLGMGEDLNEKDAASVRYSHWVNMLHRSRGRGFRLDRGTGSKRKNPRNMRRNGKLVASDLAMHMNGLKFVARYGSETAVYRYA